MTVTMNPSVHFGAVSHQAGKLRNASVIHVPLEILEEARVPVYEVTLNASGTAGRVYANGDDLRLYNQAIETLSEINTRASIRSGGIASDRLPPMTDQEKRDWAEATDQMDRAKRQIADALADHLQWLAYKENPFRGGSMRKT